MQINAEGLWMTQMLLRDLITHRSPLKSRHFGLNPCGSRLSQQFAGNFVWKCSQAACRQSESCTASHYDLLPPNNRNESGALDKLKCQEAKGRKWVWRHARWPPENHANAFLRNIGIPRPAPVHFTASCYNCTSGMQLIIKSNHQLGAIRDERHKS